MGTRHEDQPAEHWAGAESLDPTPVWKQYALVALLLLVGLVLVVIVAVAALAPQFVTPPALVPGDRLVLAASDIPAGNLAARRIGPPLVDEARAFWLKGTAIGTFAIRAHWSPTSGGPECAVTPDGATSLPSDAARRGLQGYSADCGGVTYFFQPNGDPRIVSPTTSAIRTAARGLDQYLVAVSGDRVIVNLSRVIQADQRTNAPVPTGIPQPQQTP